MSTEICFSFHLSRFLIFLIFIEINYFADGKMVMVSPNPSLLDPIFPTENHSNNDTADHIMLDDGKILKRDKRFLLFTGGGISKIVLGFLAPVETRDRVNWRTLNLAYNYQAQYVPLPNVTFLWNRFSRSLVNQRRQYDLDGSFKRDLTRELVYGAIELFLEHKGKPGRECLLKAICEAAEHPIQRTGVFEEIMHLILTPNADQTKDDYINAKLAGEFGTNCANLYPKCKSGDGLLDNITVLI